MRRGGLHAVEVDHEPVRNRVRDVDRWTADDGAAIALAVGEPRDPQDGDDDFNLKLGIIEPEGRAKIDRHAGGLFHAWHNRPSILVEQVHIGTLVSNLLALIARFGMAKVSKTAVLSPVVRFQRTSAHTRNGRRMAAKLN